MKGIIGMEDPEGVGFGLVGVAPESSIYMYRIFSCYGLTTNEIIIRAMERAADDGADLLSMSFGSAGSFEQVPEREQDPMSQMAAGLAARGIAPIVAAGNDGNAGVYYTSSPSVGDGVISVGSIANSKYPLTYTGTDSRGREFRYASVWPIEATHEFDVYVLRYSDTLNNPGYGCSIFGFGDAAATINVNTTVLVLAGSGCRKGYINWPYHGFKYVAVLEDTDYASDPFASDYWLYPRGDSDDEFFMNIASSDAKTILSMYEKAGGYGKYKWTFGNTQAKAIPQIITGGRMSNYSTFGPPVDTINLKPQISAPGGNILSTWPLGYLGGYTIISGTSMATPFLAGCYALVKSKSPDLSVSDILSILQTTASPVSYVPDNSIVSTTVHQGAGLVNPYKAITFESAISPGEFSIRGTSDYENKPRKFTIRNKSSRSKTYIISHQGAGLVQHFPYPDVLFPYEWYTFGTPQYAIYGSATFSTNQVLLGAGQSVDVEVKFSAPPRVDAAQNPIISGFIHISNNNDHFSIPYAGVPYDRLGEEYFDLSGRYTQPQFNLTPWDTFNYDLGPVYKVKTFLEFDGSNYKYPQILTSFNFYSHHIRLDVLPPNTSYVPDLYGFNTTETFDYNFSNSTLSSKFLGYDTYGMAWDHVDSGLPDWGWLSWYGRQVTTDAGDMIAVGNGDYRLLLSILRAGGNAAERESWESFLSPVIRYINV